MIKGEESRIRFSDRQELQTTFRVIRKSDDVSFGRKIETGKRCILPQ